MRQEPYHDPYNTYYEDGYHDANPWLQDKRNEEFSLSGTFPHKVRFQKPAKCQDRKPEGTWYGKDIEKGENEAAPQVPAAEDQHDELQRQRTAATQQTHRTQRDDSDATVAVDEQDFDTSPKTPPPSGASTLARRRLDGFAPNNQPIGDLADDFFEEPDPNKRPYNAWARIRMKYRRVFAEWLGTTIMVFIGVSTELTYITSGQQNASIQSVYWAWGFGAMIGIYVSGGGSGGFLNPALVIMLSAFRGFPAKRIPVYILAEVVGAFTGALLALAIYRDNILHLGQGLSPEATGIYMYTQPQPWISAASAFFTEFLITAVLGCTIMALGDSGNAPPGAGMHAFIIGLVITTCTMVGSWSTKACMNPARDFGPRLVAVAVGYPRSLFTASNNWWIWGPWCATICGAMAGGLVYDLCVFRGSESPVNYSGLRMKVEGLKEGDRWMRRLRKDKRAERIERKIEEGLAQSQNEDGVSR
ncbi:hypothetical protein LTR78_002988 [Recurvomyces mirabilis]|uniref:Aquaporin-like protein n=1 Tax=Recurvomyces mirabilis TaxID=574656 RepID=A0AAE0WTF9_9PEZI|nr:hypothetical protein LTR78_002988 [Recurvomyces mirabilis]KAK5159279.1 hypothetical protein LTS14_002421 [Recurvomyces mirabilis]